MKYLKLATIVVVFLFFIANIKAQDYSTVTEVISTGGGESTGSNYTNFGVIGETFVKFQPTGGDYEASIGFLYNTSIWIDIEYKTDNHELIVYPNPTKDYLTISNYNEANTRIEIYNVFGIKVYESEHRNKINVSQLANGIYFLRLIDDNGSVVHLEKVIKN